jgi:glycosyltransferase involved in cell wall biosynthesis
LDQAAEVLGAEAVTALFMCPVNVGGSFSHAFPSVCRYHCLDQGPECNGLPFAELERFLVNLDPTVVIVGGYRDVVSRATFRWCLASRVPYALRSDSNPWTDRLKGWARGMVRHWRLDPWVRSSARCLVTGRYNRDFWREHGMRPDQEGWWPQWIDYDHFAQARELRASSRQQLRNEFGITAPYNLLYVGRLIARKAVDRLCAALVEAPDCLGLVVAGDGPEAERITREFGQRLGARLRMMGVVEPLQLPRLYAATDILALASGATEPWAMVLNEATAAGMPIVCDEHVGAAGDLLVDGRNGLKLRGNELPDWIAAMRTIAERADELPAMGAASVLIADDWRDRSEPAKCLAALVASVS